VVLIAVGVRRCDQRVFVVRSYRLSAEWARNLHCHSDSFSKNPARCAGPGAPVGFFDYAKKTDLHAPALTSQRGPQSTGSARCAGHAAGAARQALGGLIG
jgi:hypothetical protein